MSVQLMSAIFNTEFRDLTDADGNTTKAATAKLVLLALADHANDDGEGAYPGLEKMKTKTALTKQAIINTYDALKYNGVIFLAGQSKRGTNNYTINVRSFPPMWGGQPGLLVNSVEQGGKPSLPEGVNPVDPIHPLTTTETPGKPLKKGDLLDGLIHFGNVAKERGEDKVEELLQEMERGLKINISRSLNNQKVAKRILRDGRPFSQWLTWCVSDEWRATHLYLYADLEKIWRDYPQAFQEKQETPGQKRHKL